MNCGSEGPGGVCLTVLCRQGCCLQVYRSLEGPVEYVRFSAIVGLYFTGEFRSRGSW